MAIIRYSGSEPKVNQCLKHLILLLDTKSFIFPPFTSFGLDQKWALQKSCCVIVCVALGGSQNAVLCSLLVGPQQSSSHARTLAFVASQGLALRGYYTLNQTNDWPIMRTVLCRSVCASINKLAGLVFNLSQMLLFSVHPLWCVLKARSMSKPHCTQMKISQCIHAPVLMNAYKNKPNESKQILPDSGCALL